MRWSKNRKSLISYDNYNSYCGYMYRTINVSPKTYERLVIYKHGNMSFDEVINRILGQVDEEEFYRSILEEHRERMKEIKAGKFIEADSLDEALDQI